jgi:hypothetical protein
MAELWAGLCAPIGASCPEFLPLIGVSDDLSEIEDDLSDFFLDLSVFTIDLSHLEVVPPR